MAQGHGHTGRPPGRLLWSGIGLLLVVIVGWGLVSIGGIRLPWYASEADLQRFDEVPEFALIERNGRPVRKADLLGKVWVANFIFTRCVDECPLETSRMARLQKTFAQEEAVRWVSITVDPEHDTPGVLARYARQFGADPLRWLFLTGEKMTIYRLARDGFHLGVMDSEAAPQTSDVFLPPRIRQAMQAYVNVLQPRVAWAHHPQEKSSPSILHSARFVLVDRQAQIRGYYNSREEDAMRRLQRHVAWLLRQDTS